MQDHDVLLTMAEIAVAFIGFAGIVVVFQRREADAWERTDTQRFWLMVVSALLALVFSLLPLLFIAAGRSSETTWAVCSAAMAVFVGAGALAASAAALGRPPGFSRVISGLVLLFAVPSFVVLVLNALDVGFHRSLAGYLVGLFYLIGYSAAFFARLVHRGLAVRGG